jgi:mRNA interferase YafQ
MLEPTFKKTFRKELKMMEKRHKNIHKLQDVMNMLIQEIPLLPKHEDHPLQGEYKGWWEYHVEPDWLLIYRIDTENRRIIFYRTGSHSDLF